MMFLFVLFFDHFFPPSKHYKSAKNIRRENTVPYLLKFYDTIYFIFLMWSVRDFYLKSPLIYKSPCKKIENIQKSRTEATKTF